jgi:hypothetical protein
MAIVKAGEIAESAAGKPLKFSARPGLIPFSIHTHKNWATIQAHRISNQADKNSATEFLTANERQDTLIQKRWIPGFH